MCNRKTFLAMLCVIEVSLTLNCIPSDAADAGEKADGQTAGTPAPRAHSPLLHSSAQDTEKMEQSVKLLIPAQPAPPVAVPPRQFQAGAQQSSLNAPLYPQVPSSAYSPPRDFRLGAQNIHPFVVPHFSSAPFMPMRTISPPGAPGGIWSSGGWSTIRQTTNVVSPRSLPRPTFSSSVRPVLRQTMSVQVDPWTNVVSVESTKANELANLQTAIKRLHEGKIAPPQLAAAQMRATQKVLPVAAGPSSWDEWYKRVANGIYDRWKQNTAGPGSAIVLITVYNSRDVDCRVTEFNPAAGAERNADSEQRFKQVALQCVSTLSGDAMWQFPQVQPVPKKIVFDMDFKHVVGESAGCTVVHLHTGEALDADDKKN